MGNSSGRVGRNIKEEKLVKKTEFEDVEIWKFEDEKFFESPNLQISKFSNHKKMFDHENKPADDLIFGIRAVIEAIQAGKEIDKVLIKKGLISDLFKEMFDLIRIHQIPFQYCLS